MIFIFNIKSYVPIKLCKTSGSIHLFKLTGSLEREDVNLHSNQAWDILDINWRKYYNDGKTDTLLIYQAQ